VKLKINPAVLQATFENEQLLVNPDTGRFFRLNLTAGRLYELLKAGESVESAKAALLSEFTVTQEQLTAEIERIVTSMRAEQLLVEDEE
jgi:hypothetical protein